MPERGKPSNLPSHESERYERIPDYENSVPIPGGRIRRVETYTGDAAIVRARLNAPVNEDGVRIYRPFETVQLPSPDAIALIINALDAADS